jgi:hypothetical protein
MATQHNHVGLTVGLCVVVVLLASCGSGQSSQPLTSKRSHATSTTSPATSTSTTSPATSTTTNTTPPPAAACPPGCSLPSDYDAITWLASASTSVTIDTAYANPQADAQPPFLFKVDQTLETIGAPSIPVPEGPFVFRTMTSGQEFLVFLSTWRGGLCVSTLYSFDPASQSATLLAASRDEIPLPGRELPVPRMLTLAQVEERMYPTGPFVQSTDVSESMCAE